MSLANAFHKLYIKPVLDVDFKNTKLPFLHPMAIVHRRENPYWTILAGLFSLYIGLQTFGLLAAVCSFALLMYAFKEAQIGPYAPPELKALHSVSDHLSSEWDKAAKNTYDLRKKWNFTTEEEDFQHDLEKEVQTCFFKFKQFFSCNDPAEPQPHTTLSDRRSSSLARW